jgi:polyphosphate glucokinase
LMPAQLVAQVHAHAGDWQYDAVALGYPGAVDARGPTREPGNLGSGWVGFDFDAAFDRSVRVVNDAVLQALGGYDGVRILYLGLGTGLGSALITEHVVVPLELGSLPFGDATMAEHLGRAGLEARGHAAWLHALTDITGVLRHALGADYVLLGGANVERVDQLPPDARRGGNDDAFVGGFRLWQEPVEPHDREPARLWRVVR